MNRQNLSPSRTSRPSLIKAVAIALSAYSNRRHLKSELPNWGGDSKDIELLVRAATAPATITGSAWADVLGMTAVSDLVSVLKPTSAGAELLGYGLQLQFRGAASITVPTVVAAASGTSFVKEGDPIPNRQFSFTGPRLEPRKFATLSTFCRESFEHSTPTILSLVRQTLIDDVGLALDQALFSTTAGDSTRPPGLMQGIGALSRSTATLQSEACSADCSKLAASVSRVAGNGDIVFVCAPEQRTALEMTPHGPFPYPVLASGALTAGSVIAVAANCIASATDAMPRFDISDQGTEHLDTAPQPIGSTGNVVAAVTVSLFQSDMLSLKMVFEMGWCLRSTNGLAYMTDVIW